MQDTTALGEKLLAAPEVEPVVRLARVERAAPPLDHPIGLQTPEVVGDQRLRVPEPIAELAHAAIAPCELDQDPPSQRMRCQLQEAGRLPCRHGCRGHESESIK